MSDDMTLDELIREYLDYADEYYRRGDGSPTGQAVNLELALRPLMTCMPVSRFGLNQLHRYRDGLIRRGLQRSTINQWCGWVRGCFRWAAQRGLIEPRISAELALMDPLRYGRGRSPERRLKGLVSADRVYKVSQICPPPISTMVLVQWICGMRPSEICSMRFDELRELDGWLIYLPTHHKTLHHGKTRAIVLSNDLKNILPRHEGSYVFQKRRRPAGPYTADSYAQALRKACRKQGLEVVTPGQLRRSAATLARRLAGKEAAQRLLGHTSGDMTEAYYDLEIIDAVENMQKLTSEGWNLNELMKKQRIHAVDEGYI